MTASFTLSISGLDAGDVARVAALSEMLTHTDPDYLFDRDMLIESVDMLLEWIERTFDQDVAWDVESAENFATLLETKAAGVRSAVDAFRTDIERDYPTDTI